MKRGAIFSVAILFLFLLNGISYLRRSALFSTLEGSHQTGVFHVGLSASLMTPCRMIATGGKSMSIFNSCARTLSTVLAQLQQGSDIKKSVKPIKRQRRFEQLEDRRLMSVTQDANGWTLVGASVDTRTIYVSSSTGNDANDGLSVATAKRTISAGASLMRNGMPDHLLLKRGDSFTLSTSLNGDGRSASEPTLFGTFGNGARPIVDGGDKTIFSFTNPNFIAVIGWHLESTRTPTESSLGIAVACWETGNSLLIEDNHIDGYATNINIDGNNSINLSNITIRRNVIVNSWSTNSHSQGIFADDVNGLTIEDNFLDHNGWNESIAEAEATIYNHNMYITHHNRNVTIQDNISSRGSNMGLKFQPNDGTHYVTNNLFVRNGFGLQVGGGQAAMQEGFPGATIYANNNVIIEGVQNSNQSPGLGVTFANLKGGTFNNNVIANRSSTSGAPSPLSLQDGNGWESEGVGILNFTLQSNVVYNWRGQTQVVRPDTGSPLPVYNNIRFINNLFQEPSAVYSGKLIDTYTGSAVANSFSGGKYFSAGATSQPFKVGATSMNLSSWKAATGESNAVQQAVEFFDPTRTTLTYAASLGLTTYDAFVTQISQQSRTNWRTEYTADAINAYIRAGFEMDAVGVTPLPAPSLGAPTGQSLQQQTVPQSQPQPQQQLQNFQQQLQQQSQPQPSQGSLAPEVDDSSQLSSGLSADLLVLQLSSAAAESTYDADGAGDEGSSFESLDNELHTQESAADEVFGEFDELVLAMST